MLNYKLYNRQISLLFLSFLFFNGLFAQQKNEPKKNDFSFPDAGQFKNSKLTYKLIPASNNTWCYDILADGRTIIHQPSVPGMPGNEGFASKNKATKVADLVVSKIQRGEMPPSISLIEMKKLKAID